MDRHSLMQTRPQILFSWTILYGSSEEWDEFNSYKWWRTTFKQDQYIKVSGKSCVWSYSCSQKICENAGFLRENEGVLK